ncbi:MAG: hypothetical protein M1840_006389 [Geoglossum simile]|nr:MAG: hypothetical protein M1840_006389 [Geoglossum simile]
MDVAPQKSQPAIPVQHYLAGSSTNRKPDGSRFLVEKAIVPTFANGPTPLPRRRRRNNRMTDELLKEIEQGMDCSDDSLLGTIQSETIGMNPIVRTAFLKEIAKNITILRTGASSATVPRQEFVEMAGNVSSITESNGGESAALAALSETDNFWQLQTAITSLSCATLPSYDKAKQAFPTYNVGGEP